MGFPLRVRIVTMNKKMKSQIDGVDIPVGIEHDKYLSR